MRGTALRESAIDVIIEHPAISGLPYWNQSAESGIPPHITLLYPWRTPPVDAASIDALRAAIRGIPAFSLTLTGVASFPRGVVYAAVAPDRVLRTLMQAIAACFPDTPPYQGAFAGTAPVPHLTLAQCPAERLESTRSAVADTLRDVFPLILPVGAVTVLEQSDDEMWSVITQIPLGP